jgi:tRNA nucleotidyltransferase (CCA-adding enzyme)
MTLLRLAADDVVRMAFPTDGEAYRVGGSVRDELLGREAKDFDYVVWQRTPDEIRERLEAQGWHCEELTVRQSGVVGYRVVNRTGAFEVCLPRSEVSTGPGRHGFEVVGDPHLEPFKDALRRDFTINALYRSVVTGEVEDPLGQGRDDLRMRWIRTTYPKSFAEDPLRALRALRFVSELPGFDLVESTFQEMKHHSHAVHGLTARGVSGTALTELQRILMGTSSGYALRLARESGVLAILLPELEPSFGFDQQSKYHDKTVDEHTFDAVQAAADRGAGLRVRLALLFHDSGKPFTAWLGPDGRKHYYAQPTPDGTLADLDHEVVSAQLAEAALKRLNAPRELRHDVVRLVREHMLDIVATPRPIKVRHKLADLGERMLADLLLHILCDGAGKDGPKPEVIAGVVQWQSEANRALLMGCPLKVTDLNITGADVPAKGPTVGLVLRALLHECMADPSLNYYDWLVRRAGKLAKKPHDLHAT